jgi:hypothetical protein
MFTLNNTDFIEWRPENIVILTNGYCGSTCALFSRNLHEHHGVRTFTVGGLVDQSMAYSVFPGGQVYSYTSLLGQVSKLGVDPDEHVPTYLPLNAQVSFTIREAYSSLRKYVPLEFGIF